MGILNGSEETSTQGEDLEMEYDISMAQWREAVRGVLPKKWDFVPHNSFLKILRIVFLRAFRGYTVKDALDDADLSEPTYYKGRYKSLREWLFEKARGIRRKLEAGQKVGNAVPKSSKDKLKNKAVRAGLKAVEENKKLKRAYKELKRKHWKLKGKKEVKGELEESKEEREEGNVRWTDMSSEWTGKEEEPEEEEVSEEEKVLEEAHKRVEEGENFVASEE